MAGPTDILTAIQNGVTAVNNLASQVKGSFNNISSQLTANAAAITSLSSTVSALSSTIPTTYVRTIAGNSSDFTLNGPSGITNTVNDIQLSQGSSSQFGAVKVNGTTITAAAGVVSLAMSPITNSLSSDVLMNNTANYFDGPSVAQGSSGTWFASGAVSVQDSGTQNQIFCKLWDGTTVIAAGATLVPSGAPSTTVVALSGVLVSPAGNLRISCRDATASGKIIFNQTGNSKDSTITAIRIG